MPSKKSHGRGQGLWAAAAVPGHRRLRLAGPLTCLPVILILALWRHSVTQQLAQQLQGAGSEASPNGGSGSGSVRSTPALLVASNAPPGTDGSSTSAAGCAAGYYCPTHSYPNVAAAELLPFLLRRRAQKGLERRWGVPPVLSPRPLPQGSTMRIPRILHHVSFPTIDAFLDKASVVGSSTQEAWAEGCRRMHPDWQYMFWDWDSAVELVKTYYPAHLEMFESFDMVIKQADAIRMFVMHSFGGLYLDQDVECFVPVDRWLGGYDVVLQRTAVQQPADGCGKMVCGRANPGPTNGIIASVPGHPLWVAVLEEMLRRWQEDPHLGTVVEATGPALMSAVFKGLEGVTARPGQKDEWAGEFQIWGTQVKAYEWGSWYHPCEWDDHSCHKEMMIKRALGAINYTDLAGYHRFAASWTPGNAAGIFSEKELEKALC